MASSTEKKSTIEERLEELEAKYIELSSKYQADSKHATNSDSPIKTSSTDEPITDKKPTEQAARFRILINRFDEKAGENRDFPPDESIQPTKDTVESGLAWQLRKFPETDSLNDNAQSEIEIFGTELIELLKKTLRHHPQHVFLGADVNLESPFGPLVLNWDNLWKETVDQDGDDEATTLGRRDLKDLLKTLQTNSGDRELDEYFKMRDSLQATQNITFQALWTIFPPGTVVYSRAFMKEHQIFVALERPSSWPVRSRGRRDYNSWVLPCFTYDWNGKRFGRRKIHLQIDPFDGLKPIATLSVRPFEGLENKTDIERTLLQRGQKFRDFCTRPEGERLFNYQGKALFDSRKVTADDSDEEREDDQTLYRRNRDLRYRMNREQIYTQVESDVMVDYESYLKYCSNVQMIGNNPIAEESGACECKNCREDSTLQKTYRAEYDDKTGARSESWDQLQHMLCAPRVLGYVLQNKAWAQLNIETIADLKAVGAEDAFMKKLKLTGKDGGQATKKLLMGLIKIHGVKESEGSSDIYQIEDIVQDKGKGLIVLLYGPPGVGKTSTAQTVAKAVGKPLFPIGVADVGTSAKKVESNLEKIFYLATIWKAVLLIDEADVFLQSRAIGEAGPSLERNALVSVFLRVLEYYQGIMILTTNQIAQFDVAVQSRIHIAIKYDKLGEDQTLDIFKSFLDQYQARGLVDSTNYDQILTWANGELARKKFDGRQIRNIVSSAMGVARARGKNEKMGYTDVTAVVNIMDTFKTDLAYQMMQYEESQRSRVAR